MSDYFIRIDDSTDVRRKTLEASKGSIHVLRAYQQLLVIRSQKRSLYNDLRRDLKDVTLLLNKAEQLLPTFTQQELEEFAAKRQETQRETAQKNSMKAIVVKPVGKPTPAAKKRPDAVSVSDIDVDAPEPKSDLQRLEEALSKVEEKLGKL
jgi:hypothetical protein